MSIKWPQFNVTLPPLNFNLTNANTTSSSSGGGGGHGGHGSSSSVNNKVTVLQQIILNPIFLIVVVIAIAAIMSVYAIKSISGKRPKKKSNKKDGEGKDYKKSYDSRSEKNDVLQAVPETKTYSNSDSRNYILFASIIPDALYHVFSSAKIHPNLSMGHITIQITV